MRDFLIFPVLFASQFLASFIVNGMSYSTLQSFRNPLRARSWELEGQVYQKLFRIKAWKDLVPELGRITPEKFTKRHIESDRAAYLEQFILESIRAELCHAFSLFFAVPIFLFVPTHLRDFALLYIILINVPCIMIQRTNRPRLERILRHTKNSGVMDPVADPEPETQQQKA
ncbi:MAG: hypothetical protein PHO44_06985 [Sphaerochaetaceae bacterium]|jgi:glycosyl-4,4'-diaponeurosporenoate acyltransferase|nr:hypothetical protein [Sphaerochaetaceae bacterium]MDD4397003.1 hypothetical protein [Sphaerochaetaceae bacterium]